MFKAVRRYLSFIGHSKSKNAVQLSDQTIDGAALTVQDDSTNSASWCTILSEGDPNDESRERVDSETSDKQPKNLIRDAISLVKRRAREEYIVNHDISNGREYHKIPAISYRQDDKAPLDFHYVTGHINWESLNKDTSLSKIHHCGCTQDCREDTCRCSVMNKNGFHYDSRGRLSSFYNFKNPPLIMECNAACGCNPKLCKNMIIQRGPRCRVVLFRTKNRGWGIRSLVTLKRGTFVGVYSGELLMSSKSIERLDDTYLFNLSNSNLTLEHQKKPLDSTDTSYPNDTKSSVESPNQEKAEQDEQYVCDAKFFGNYTRFINHSCNPNVIGIKSYTDHQDHRYPHIAFFTSKDIPAFSELTLNYGDSYWLVKCKRDSVYCLCRQPECRFSKKTFSRTLKEHIKSLSKTD